MERPTSSEAPSTPLIIRAGAGEKFDFGSYGVHWKIEGSQAGGRFSVVHHPLAPRSLGAPLHRHHREDEYSYVLTGVFGALLGDTVITAAHGCSSRGASGIPFGTLAIRRVKLSRLSRRRGSRTISANSPRCGRTEASPASFDENTNWIWISTALLASVPLWFDSSDTCPWGKLNRVDVP